MKLNENNLKKILALLEILEGKEESNTCPSKEDKENIRIVILQGGWVFIGRFKKHGSQCELHNAYCIRRWGKTDGLGQLAIEGKQEETILEKTPTLKFHELTVIATIDCEESKWNSLI